MFGIMPNFDQDNLAGIDVEESHKWCLQDASCGNYTGVNLCCDHNWRDGSWRDAGRSHGNTLWERESIKGEQKVAEIFCDRLLSFVLTRERCINPRCAQHNVIAQVTLHGLLFS